MVTKDALGMLAAPTLVNVAVRLKGKKDVITVITFVTILCYGAAVKIHAVVKFSL